MGTVTVYTADRMKRIEDTTVVDGVVSGDNLILTQRNGTQINAGSVRGPQGIQGPIGEVPEAPKDDKRYARRNGLWVPVTEEAPADGKYYARRNSGWTEAPAVLLGSVHNPTDSTTTSSNAVSFGGGGTILSVPVGSRGVTVDFGATLVHSKAPKFIFAQLFVDDVLFTRGIALFHVIAAGQQGDLFAQCVFTPGELTTGTHKFEVKAKQEIVDSTLTLLESWMTIRGN